MKLLLVTLLLLSCAKGIAPPEPTPMVKVVTDDYFLFGDTELCVDKYQTPKCEEGSPIPCDTFPTMKVKLDPFLIDIHEVTNFQYEYCHAVGPCPDPEKDYAGFLSDYYSNPKYRDYPKLTISWEAAEQYCEWLGRRLPTEFEWERVAGGPAKTLADKRRYPFQEGAESLDLCKKKTKEDISLGSCVENADPKPVGSSPYDVLEEGGKKIYDMAGNASEWTLNQYQKDVTCADTVPDECDCCANCSSNQTDAEYAECKAKCTSCDACDPAKVSTSDPPPVCEAPQCEECRLKQDACFRICAGEKSGDFPLCIEYASVVDAECLPVSIEGFKGMRLARGGSFSSPENSDCRIRSAARYDFMTKDMKGEYDSIGFRCAKDAE